MKILISAVLFVIFAGVNCSNFRNPAIQRLQHFMCMGKRCGFEEVCEIRTAPCFFPPCPYVTYCTPTWGSANKGGSCPAVDYIGVGTIQCFGDFGCGISNNDVCCHNRYTKTSRQFKQYLPKSRKYSYGRVTARLMSAVLCVIFTGLNCTNYRNPEIQGMQQTMCKDKHCVFEQVCEIRTAHCLIPPCPYVTYCAPTWGSLNKGGACPAADDISVGTVQCFGDFGCGISNNDVCCHNRNTKSSYCHKP
ncbi:unnamed protein product [Mytilus coruscus]|uniref:Uncharacterized protein n=1 Tax=Mytilus coruscus TaxID=42192 RepID=A0A6J8EUI6_MYTCO|nr:unnamed protein product [Mytilus coruscus]